ncbi:helix-turn-helix domain-containing protein [Lactobacillus taiwanensis]|uniref:helix-turn-helix domain-containing protein n=1 Tax=Lactobacillus taiwanensis TaxID=508451 RepID=UPI0025580FDE|nr:helix-turn-helix transcriptional regulator [Lactobacillus taiwanensis]
MNLNEFMAQNYYDFHNPSKPLKINKEIFLKRAKYLGPEYILSSEYKGSRQRVTFYHTKCGKEWAPTAEEVMYKHSHCPCTSKFRNPDYGRNRVDKFLESHNCKRISEYKDMKHPIKIFSEKCKHIFLRTPDILLNQKAGAKCPICRKKPARFQISNFMKEEIKWRKSKGFTQKDVGDFIHCCDHLISDFENGHKKPSKKQIAEIKSYMDALTIGG